MTTRFHRLLSALVLVVMVSICAAARAQDAGQVEQSREACRDGRGDVEACVSYGLALLNGVTVAEDPAGAARVWRAACDRSHLTACAHLAWVLYKSEGVEHDVPEAMRLYLRACEGRVASACLSAGYMLQEGQGAPVDLARARGRFNSACLYGNGTGCREEGSMYYDGLGGNQSFSDALTSTDRPVAWRTPWAVAW